MSATGLPSIGVTASAEKLCALPNPAATEGLGGRIATHLRDGDLVALFGDLGVGKTTLSRGILRGLGYEGPAPSPTFTLVQHYVTDGLSVAHFDLYRLASREEIFELGLDEALHEGVVLIEWPEILGDTLPNERLEVHLADADEGRMARLVGRGHWFDCLGALAV
jgi:tRNA threonylcarbamoyl adenosine modification protein YjeE